ncbi:AAA family ATPase [Actinobacillus porcitonsillarum]|nr:AAA family ATPase [Actinobacillus porcitonsillarum]
MRFEIENVGKLKKAKFELKPLTIFIGKNNSGKTYATTALWALINYLKNLDVINFISSDLRKKYNDLFKSKFMDLNFGNNVNVNVNVNVLVESTEIKKIQEVINKKLVEESKEILNNAFRFSHFENSKLKLLNDTFEDVGLNLSVKNLGVDSFYQITIKHNEINTNYEIGVIVNTTSRDELIEYINKIFWDYIAKLSYSVNEFSELWHNIYIPAARTGIVLNLNNIISGPFRGQLFSKDDLERKTNDFTQPTLNFALHLNSLLFDNDKEYTYLKELMGGKIKINSSTNRYEYLPNKTDKSIPLSASSSLVTELTPMAILGADSVRKDFILFEEPEAHLHLEAQREMAKALVKMVNKGKKILITTHSDTFLQQLNNLILLERLKKQGKDISVFDISEDELLSESNVVTYEFKCNSEITDVEQLTCGDYGFIADSLNEVLIALAKETNSIIDLIDEK